MFIGSEVCPFWNDCVGGKVGGVSLDTEISEDLLHLQLQVVAGDVEDASRDCVREERPTQPSRLVGTTKKVRVLIALAD